MGRVVYDNRERKEGKKEREKEKEKEKKNPQVTLVASSPLPQPAVDGSLSNVIPITLLVLSSLSTESTESTSSIAITSAAFSIPFISSTSATTNSNTYGVVLVIGTAPNNDPDGDPESDDEEGITVTMTKIMTATTTTKYQQCLRQRY